MSSEQVATDVVAAGPEPTPAPTRSGGRRLSRRWLALIGAVVLTWWLGAYALVFGVALVILSLKLRSRQHERVSPTAVGTAA